MRGRLLLLTVLLVFGALVAALNWESMRTPLRLELLVATVETAVGWVVLIVALLPAVVLLLAGLLDQARALRRVDALERRLEEARAAAERTRSTEIEGLAQEIDGRVAALRAALEGMQQGSDSRLEARLDGLEAQLAEGFEGVRERVVLVRDELAADIAEAEDALLRGRTGPAPTVDDVDDAGDA